MEAKQTTPFTKLLAIILSSLFLLSLIPVFSAARYAAPESDDQLYGQEAQAVFEETGSLFQLFGASKEKVAHHHQVAHGRFTNTFFGASFLGGFGLTHYWSVPVIMLLALIGSALLFAYALLCRVLGLDKPACLCIALVALLFCVHLMPSPAEGLFWFCGGLGYTLYFSGTLTLFALLLLADRANTKGKRTLFGVLGALVALVVSGLGFTLMISTGALLAGYLVLTVVQKRREMIPWISIALAVLAIGSLIQLTAPGVAARAAWEQELYGYSPMSAPKAIAMSFVYAICMLLNRLDGGMLLFIAMVCVLLAKPLKDRDYAFRLPGLVLAGSLCLYATLFTASLYATSSMGPYRQWNVMYFAQFIFWGVNAGYFTGWWLKQQQKKADFPKRWALLSEWSAGFAKRRAAALCVIAALMLSAVLVRGIFNTTGVAALREVTNGSAAARYAAWQQEQFDGADQGPREESRLYLY